MAKIYQIFDKEAEKVIIESIVNGIKPEARDRARKSLLALLEERMPTKTTTKYKENTKKKTNNQTLKLAALASSMDCLSADMDIFCADLELLKTRLTARLDYLESKLCDLEKKTFWSYFFGVK